MPKELARVMARYADLQKQARPLSLFLTSPHGHDYIMFRDQISELTLKLAKTLNTAGMPSTDDPRITRGTYAYDLMKDIKKRQLLMADRKELLDKAAKDITEIRAEALKLQTDVLAVAKAKSGFFSTSKSGPKLQALSTALTTFAAELAAVAKWT